MNTHPNHEKTSRYINWITVWGLFFGCIAYNLYVDNHQRHQVESQRADSLYKETVRLQQRLRKAESVEKISTNRAANSQKLALVGTL
jgi:hypothetical protein